MPTRKTALVENEFYHVFNRGAGNTIIFPTAIDYQRILDLCRYCRYYDRPLRFSFFIRLRKEEQEKILKQLRQKGSLLVKILSFCFMPNHFHFLVQQTAPQGISVFFQSLQNSYARYFNTKYKRKGPLFEGRFKTVRVESEEQLLHLARYIELNPYSGLLVKRVEELKSYPWSSLKEYLKGTVGLCDKELILSYFQTKREYEEFIFNHADYQRSLAQIKKLLLHTPGV